ncbi:MAG TPA: tetratricopeptide repeat protein [Candidatus Marinimicrobia bacterium]|nr:tetratricopeptide repeat protein [Candidatus Neomarinimicrobiota bacterium]HRS51773.1 tetratricopeptide repeat protein [Candidatus Neomarinimicrobiota bacterium]HRU93043.1 tetratricopeptide repeat protein [Candidatus Neomarinimicrobiota bacterium]
MTPILKYDKKIMQLISLGQYEEALWIAEEELCYAESNYGHQHLETAKVLNNLGWICDILNKDQSAEEYYLKALEVKIAVCGGTSHELIPTLENLVNFFTNHNQLARAYEFLVQLIDLAGVQNKFWRLRKGVYLCQLAELEEQLGFPDKAENLLWESLSFLQANYGFDHPNAGRVFAKLGAFFERQGNLARAEYCYNRSLKLLKKHLPSNHPDVKFSRDGLYNIYSELGIKVKIP